MDIKKALQKLSEGFLVVHAKDKDFYLRSQQDFEI